MTWPLPIHPAYAAAMVAAVALGALFPVARDITDPRERRTYRLLQALTFLGCVVAPLNLWFYHAQNLITVQGHLWVGGVVCCLLYAATVNEYIVPFSRP